MSSFYVVQILFFIVECGIARFLCAMCTLCAYSTFGHHPHPLGYPCVKLCFCRTLHCWASSRRKTAYSINHSLSHAAYLIRREQKLSLQNKQAYRFTQYTLPQTSAYDNRQRQCSSQWTVLTRLLSCLQWTCRQWHHLKRVHCLHHVCQVDRQQTLTVEECCLHHRSHHRAGATTQQAPRSQSLLSICTNWPRYTWLTYHYPLPVGGSILIL